MGEQVIQTGEMFLEEHEVASIVLKYTVRHHFALEPGSVKAMDRCKNNDSSDNTATTLVPCLAPAIHIETSYVTFWIISFV